ncbi:hypothetical protein [Dictyobacter vulcani]|uniref:hypothetical protein n=1 Tax=Dictyobacter vulcani TaxID=2607529 RepID=UPI00124FFF6B|nr:hypothetical protein [Dictyobacter vulcani]
MGIAPSGLMGQSLRLALSVQRPTFHVGPSAFLCNDAPGRDILRLVAHLFRLGCFLHACTPVRLTRYVTRSARVVTLPVFSSLSWLFSLQSFSANRHAPNSMTRPTKTTEALSGFQRHKRSRLMPLLCDGAKQAYYLDTCARIGMATVLRMHLSLSPWHRRHGMHCTECPGGDASHTTRCSSSLAIRSLTLAMGSHPTKPVTRGVQNTISLF